MPEQTKPSTTPKTDDAGHPGMMGDGTEEQNLGQPGDPTKRITQEEVEEAFKDGGSKPKADR